MTISILGQLAAPGSFMIRRDHLDRPIPWKVGYRWRHQADLPLRLGHADPIGSVDWLGQGEGVGLLVVARIVHDEVAMEAMLAEGDWFLSPTAWMLPTGPLQLGGGELEEISLVRNPATTGLKPLVWRKSDIALDSAKPAGVPLSWHDAWRMAHEALSAARFRYEPNRQPLTDDFEFEYLRQGVRELLHPSQGLRVVDLDPTPALVGSAPPGATQGPSSAPGTGLVRWEGKDLGPRMSRMVREQIDLGTPLGDIARMVRSSV